VRFCNTVYSYAQLSEHDWGIVRFGGSGLGILLFPWARCVVASAKYRMTPIAPTWPSFKIGPLLRRERDLRTYRLLFHPRPEEMTGARKLLLLARLPHVEEEWVRSIERETDKRGGARQNVVVVFRGRKNYFMDILAEHALVRTELIEMTLDVHRKSLKEPFNPAIYVHVRLGDYRQTGRMTPIDWYRCTITAIRRAIGVIAPVNVVSDGYDRELAPLLALENVRRVSYGSSIADLLAMSTAAVLVASGQSTFGQWASYLGRMPVVWPTGYLTQKLYYDMECGLEIEHSPGMPLPGRFLEACMKRLLDTRSHTQ